MSTIIVGGWVNETAMRRVNETAMRRVNETATRRVSETATRRVGRTATRQWPASSSGAFVGGRVICWADLQNLPFFSLPAGIVSGRVAAEPPPQ